MFLEPELTVCDCLGLDFPSCDSSIGEMVL
jgi:hypothetical protein